MLFIHIPVVLLSWKKPLLGILLYIAVECWQQNYSMTLGKKKRIGESAFVTDR